MALDLESLAKSKTVVVPILNKSFQLNRKPYTVESEDGWFSVEITGNKVRVIEQAFEIEPNAIGYTHNNTIVFSNFDVALRKWKMGPIANLYFNRSQSFEAVWVRVWEDKKVFYCQADYRDTKIFELADLFNKNEEIVKAKGVTPEMRMLYLHHLLEREQQLSLAAEIKAKEDHERMMRDIPYRLAVTFKRAGAEMTKYSMTGNRIVVDWKLHDSDFEYNSVIDSRTWMVVEAGYCMSQDDKRHNITSMVKLAEDYEEKNLTYITRRT